MHNAGREVHLQRLYAGLGLRNGMLIGLALALGTLGPHALALSRTHYQLPYLPLILGATLLTLLGGLGGWLATWPGNALVGGLVWILTAVLMILVIGHLPYEGLSLSAWLANRRFWGLLILPFDDAAAARMWTASVFVGLLLAFLGLLQGYRLEGLRVGVSAEGRLDARAWLALLLPLPLVFAVGLLADGIVNSPMRDPLQVLDEVIQTGRTYPGDLMALSREQGRNYNAIAGVRDLMSEDFSLLIGEADLSAAQTVLVVAHFDNGAWIVCWVLAGNLSFCSDASPPYLQGFPALLATGATPPDCQKCAIQVDGALRAWLAARQDRFAGAPRVSRTAQWGSYVLMRAQSPSGDYGLECRFHGLRSVQLEKCWEVEGSLAPAEVVDKDLRPRDSESGADTTAEAPPTPAASSATDATVTSTPTADTALARYAPAMRPAFVDDLASVGPLSQYRIEVTVDPDNATVSGMQTVSYVNTSLAPQEAVYFRLLPNLPSYGGEMSVSDVRVEEASVTADLKAAGTALRVPLPTPLPPGGQATVTMDFKTTVPLTVGVGYAQFVYLQDVMALANFFPLIPAYDEGNCARFGNCDAGWNIEVAVPYGDAVFSPTALFDVFVTAPAGWTVVASGSTVEQQSGSADAITWHIVGGPLRDFNLVLSPRFQVATRQLDDITVNSYFLPEDAAGGRRVLGWVVEALGYFSTQFGHYPFAEFDAVATPTVAGGIEYPGLIAMPIRRYGDASGVFQWSTVHEVAHQWWYSLVGNDQQDEPWLDEALTQYSTALYFEFVVGWDGAVAEVFESRYQEVAGTDEDDLISRPVAAYTRSNYGDVVYGKGPLFFHALRQELGDQSFLTILRRYFETYRYRNASGPDFLALTEAVSGEDLSDLYQEWLGDLN